MSAIIIQEDRHPAIHEKGRWFDYEHLKGNQRQVSAEFARLAQKLVQMLGDGPQHAIALQHLIEAKDAAVRQSIVDEEAK